MRMRNGCCHSFLRYAICLAILLLISVSSSAQTLGTQSGDSESVIHPRTFLLKPSSHADPAIADLTDTSVESSAGGGGTAGQSTVPGIPVTFTSVGRNAPRRQELTLINFGPKYVNVLFGGFEQGGGFGFGIELTTANELKYVELRARALISTRFYRRFELSAFFPRIIDEKNKAEVWFSYVRRTRDTFFGIGSRSNEGARTNFDSEIREVEGMFYRDLTKAVQTGIYLGRLSLSNYRGQNEDEPPIDVLFSGDPNVQPITRWAPALKVPLKLFAYGAFLEIDGRNDDRGLTRGGFFYARVASVDGLNNPTPTTYGWTEGQLDGRVYFNLYKNKTSFALRGNADLRSPKGGSQVPYYMNAFLGGRSFVRGYSNFRFRSHNLLMFAGELRQTIWTRKETQGFDVVAFGDVGRSWGDTRSKTEPSILRNDKFGEAPWRAGYGPGVQFRYNKDFAIRLDWAQSPEGSMWYFSVSRGF